ncbi:hypothetical protein HMPREF0294_1043 [Corynebacterium glucuronolyticum ATCC 51867]|nr:hypothetical protein HMPREF0294_1043 [Corynebacterium glucuronolyticum ATCC 51867]
MVNLNNVNASDDPVWGQDDCHAAVDLLGGFFACRGLMVPTAPVRT